MKVDLEKGGIYTFNNFLTDKECEKYDEIVRNPPQQASAFTQTGGFDNKKWTDPELSSYFYSLLKNHISDKTINNNEFPNILRANTLIMTGNYNPGQQFNMHTDTGLYYNIKEKSRWTLLIYLNDDYEGGHTLFYDDDFKFTKDITPKKGMALLFDIDLWHRGDVIITGNKRWIGCEIISSH